MIQSVELWHGYPEDYIGTKAMVDRYPAAGLSETIAMHPNQPLAAP